jgi:hypothetical protein
MYRFWVARLAVLAAAGLLALAPSTAAWAATIDINPDHVDTTAAEFDSHGCDFGGGPYPDKDVWVFVLPGPQATAGDFVTVTITFGQNGTLTIPTDGGEIVLDKGTSKAWIVTPAGWTLTAASAEITGEAKFFNLTHTCPASGTPTPTTPAPTPTTPEPTAATPGPVPSEDVTTGPAGVKPSGAPETGGGGGSTTTGGMALGVGALTLAGASGLGLALARRRRRGA